MAAPRWLNLLLICLATGGWSFGFGVASQLVSHWMNDAGASNEQIGWNHSAYYLGVAVASLAVPPLTRRFGHRAAGVGMLACAPTLVLFPWAGGATGWFVLRLLNGAAGALSVIPLESLVSRDAPPAERARNFAFYGVALTLGGAFGIWAGLGLYTPGDPFPFYLGSVAPAAGGLAVLAWLRIGPAEAAEPAVASPLPLQWRQQLLSYGTAWSQGFLEGGMLAFLALFLESRGLSAEGAGDVMGVTMIGVIVFQVPVSWLADRCGRRPVLLGCYAVAMAAMLLAPSCPAPFALAVCLFVFGACSGAMYPLGLALLGEGLPASSLPRVYSWYLAAECAGSLMGAPAMGRARDVWGQGSMFAVGFAALGLVLAVWAATVLTLSRGLTAGERRGVRPPVRHRRRAGAAPLAGGETALNENDVDADAEVRA